MTPEHFKCPDCGPHVLADEDGCCATCGVDCIGEPCTCKRDLDRSREVVRDLLTHNDDAANAAFDGDVIDIPQRLADRAMFEAEQLPNE